MSQPRSHGRSRAPRRPGRSRTPVDRIRAPYGFVPLNPRVVLPEWGSAASRDLPFEDGLCGTLDIRIEAHSPIFVRGTDSSELPFRLPDGMWALPGTSLRGMLRNVIEIATLGKLDRVNDHRFALRDLRNRPSYLEQMAKIVDGQPVPLVNAGWLVPTGEAAAPARIVPCHFAKLEYAQLRRLAASWGVEGFDPGAKQSAVKKYDALGASDALRAIRVSVDDIPRRVRDVPIVSGFGAVSGVGSTQGHLVMTGQPSTYDPDQPPRRHGGHPKHHDFVFHGQAGAPLPVSARLFRDFEFAHADRGQQNRLSGASQPNDEWAFWRRRVFPEGPSTAAHAGALHDGVPVFFLLDSDGQLRAMGLAMMFRLSARTSVRQAIERVQPEVSSPHPDFAETLFGRVPDPGRGDALERRASVADEAQYALAGRVSVAVARAEGAVRPEERVREVVLSTPKASYYPSYLEQGLTPGTEPGRGSKGGVQYTTWMEPHAIPRGWKRYRPLEGRETIEPPRPRSGDGQRELSLASTGTRFRPLPAGTCFQGRIRLHNVRPVELGALLWALDFGGADGTYHMLGLARPLGYGKVSVKLTRSRVQDAAGAPFSPDGCVDVFRTFMDQQWQALGGSGAWEDSRPIRELVALARPQPSESARHMQINHPQHDNEFGSAKTEGLVLEPATKEGSTLPWPSEVLDERRKWGRDAPRGDRASRGSGPGAGRRSVPPSRPRALPSLPSAGDVVQVRIEKRSAKGKWRATLVDLGAMGTFTRGTEPPDLSPGSEVQATVIRAPSKSSIELEWKQDADS